MAYRHTTISFLRNVLAMSVIGLTFLPVAQFSRCLLSKCSCYSLLKAIRPKRLPDKMQASPGVLSSSSSGLCSHKFRQWSMLLHLWLLLCVLSLLLIWRRHAFHNVQSLIFHNLMEVLTICFATSSSTIFLKNLLCPPASQTWLLSPVLSSDATASCPLLPQT
jgi:hypothetical protein